MNEIFSITFLYTHQPSHKNIAPRPFRTKAVRRFYGEFFWKFQKQFLNFSLEKLLPFERTKINAFSFGSLLTYS